MIHFFLKFLIYSYRASMGFSWGGNCRYHPSCSQYALDVLNLYRNQPRSALKKIIRRLLSCAPWGGFGFDPAGIEAMAYPVSEEQATKIVQNLKD